MFSQLYLFIFYGAIDIISASRYLQKAVIQIYKQIKAF